MVDLSSYCGAFKFMFVIRRRKHAMDLPVFGVFAQRVGRRV